MNSQIIKFLSLFLCCSLVAEYAVAAPPAPIPQTGQTQSNLAGDDGSLQKGTIGTNSAARFVAGKGVEANCVTDKQTGLMWVKDLKTIPIKGSATSGSPTTWQNAIDSISDINVTKKLCGHDDWRLPNIKELRSLVNYGYGNQLPWLAKNGFTNLDGNYIWSSTTGYGTPSFSVAAALVVDMYSGGTVGRADKTETSLGHVWPVRNLK